MCGRQHLRPVLVISPDLLLDQKRTNIFAGLIGWSWDFAFVPLRLSERQVLSGAEIRRSQGRRKFEAYC